MGGTRERGRKGSKSEHVQLAFNATTPSGAQGLTHPPARTRACDHAPTHTGTHAHPPKHLQQNVQLVPVLPVVCDEGRDIDILQDGLGVQVLHSVQPRHVPAEARGAVEESQNPVRSTVHIYVIFI